MQQSMLSLIRSHVLVRFDNIVIPMAHNFFQEALIKYIGLVVLDRRNSGSSVGFVLYSPDNGPEKERSKRLHN